MKSFALTLLPARCGGSAYSRDGGSDEHELHRPSEIDDARPEAAARGGSLFL